LFPAGSFAQKRHFNVSRIHSHQVIQCLAGPLFVSVSGPEIEFFGGLNGSMAHQFSKRWGWCSHIGKILGIRLSEAM
jgi:hypothetical protein